MRTPRLGVNWRLSLFDARVTETIQTNSDTRTDVLGFKVYSRTPEIVQGGIKNVTCWRETDVTAIAWVWWRMSIGSRMSPYEPSTDMNPNITNTSVPEGPPTIARQFTGGIAVR
jgi:hypothetical protein